MLENEPLILISGLAAEIQSSRTGGTLRPAALWRWHAKGVRANGTVVKLEALTIAGKLYSSRAALARFIAAQQHPSAESSAAPTPVRSPVKRQKASERAAEELSACGI